MIRLRLIKGTPPNTGAEDPALLGFELRGHADFDRYGRDIVCAAASCLAITTVNSLEAQLGTAGKVSSREGFLSCRLPQHLDSAQWQTSQVILRTLIVGFEGLVESYPEHVSVEFVRIKGGA